MEPTGTAPPGVHAEAALRFRREVAMSPDAEGLLAELLRLPSDERTELLRRVHADVDPRRATVSELVRTYSSGGPIAWPPLVATSTTTEESQRAIDEGRRL